MPLSTHTPVNIAKFWLYYHGDLANLWLKAGYEALNTTLSIHSPLTKFSDPFPNRPKERYSVPQSGRAVKILSHS